MKTSEIADLRVRAISGEEVPHETVLNLLDAIHFELLRRRADTIRDLGEPPDVSGLRNALDDLQSAIDELEDPR